MRRGGRGGKISWNLKATTAVSRMTRKRIMSVHRSWIPSESIFLPSMREIRPETQIFYWSRRWASSIQDLLRISKVKYSIFREIMQPGSSGWLRNPLLENYDYISVTDKVWRYLRAWYGCDAVIARLLVIDQGNPQRYVLDLYPTKKVFKGTDLSESTLEKISRDVKLQLMSEKIGGGANSMIIWI